MKKLLGTLLLVGVAAVVVRSLLGGKETPGEEPVQISFDDGSTDALSSKDIEGREFTDIARKLVEIGV